MVDFSTLKCEILGNIYGFNGGNYAGNVYDRGGLAPTIHVYQGGNAQPLVIEIVEVKEE